MVHVDPTAPFSCSLVASRCLQPAPLVTEHEAASAGPMRGWRAASVANGL